MASKVQRPIIVSSAEKAARASLLRSAQLGLESMQGRVVAATKGAFSGRKLRAAGDTLDRYNMGDYANTYGKALAPPAQPPGTAGSNRPGGTNRGGPTKAERERAAANRASAAVRRHVRQEGRKWQEEQRKLREEERRRKMAEAAALRARRAADKKAAQAKKGSEGSTRTAPGGSRAS